MAEANTHETQSGPPPRSLRELINRVTGRGLPTSDAHESSGLAEIIPYPFLAIVGQPEMRISLLLGLINPAIGGVLLIGPRGTGKTTAVRSLVKLLPQSLRSLCYYGCMPEDIENGGIDSVCPDCAIKYAHGEPLAKLDQVRLVELPLNSRLDDVLGKFDERLSGQNRVQFRKGLLAQADRNLLYVDEVNLLPDDVIDVLLDAASQGSYIVRRGPIASTYWSRFLLIGSMNPEEGNLRPQIQDRFGLRVLVRGLTSTTERYEVYKRVNAFKANPWQVTEFYEAETMLVQEEIQAARTLLQTVVIPEESARLGLELITRLKIDSLRAEITLFEAARAHAAADKRQEVSAEDLGAVGHMALRLRRSAFMQEYLHKQEEEEQEMSGIIDTVISPKSMERQT